MLSLDVSTSKVTFIKTIINTANDVDFRLK